MTDTDPNQLDPSAVDPQQAAEAVEAHAPVDEVPRSEASEPTDPTEAASVDAASVDADAEGVDADADGEEDDESGEGAEASADGAPADGEKKKRRRRRRRKKKGPEGEAGAEAAPGEEGAEAPRHEGSRGDGSRGDGSRGDASRDAGRGKKEPHHPFQRLFDGAAPRRHAFAVGEIVAGRVTAVREDVAVVDLFGKATAFARAHEPRDIPVAPEVPEVEAEESSPGERIEASASGAPEVSGAEATGAEATGAEATGAEATGAEATGAEATGAEATGAEIGASTDAGEQAAGEGVEPASTQPASTQPASIAVESEPAAAELESADADDAHASDDVDGDDEDGAPTADVSREPVPEPSYVLQPEGVPVIEAGGIFRGRVGAVAESGHIALVNEPVDLKTTRTFLRRAKDDRTRVPGLVFGYNRGGFDVLVYGVRAFCPVSGMTMDMVDDPDQLLGQWAQFHVQSAKSGAQGLVVSRRSILEKEARKRAKSLLKSLEPGQTVRGRVTQVRDYGLFVDIGGIEGLLHQSELSWERGVRPEDVAKAGDEIDVQILKVHERESKRERHDRVSLSTKALQPDPWRDQVDHLVEGQPRKGTVVRTAEFGAFVQLAPGVDGLLHISELGRELKHADQVVQVGDEIHIVVERIDRKARRVSLSRLSPEDAEAFEKGELVTEAASPRVKQGGNIRVRVTQVGSAGLYVQVDNVVGRRGRGFIPNSEMGTPRGTDHRRQWPPGTELDVLVIGTDRDGGLRCSRKRFLMDEERRAVREYRKEVSKQGFGTFGDILRQKLGVDR